VHLVVANMAPVLKQFKNVWGGIEVQIYSFITTESSSENCGVRRFHHCVNNPMSRSL
jgi:hypothetical protein